MAHEHKPINMSSILNMLDEIQEETGKQVAERIEFLGCSTFTNLTSELVSYYREQSKKLNSEIVGTTDYYIALPFTPNEKLISFKNGEVGYFHHGGIYSYCRAII